MRAKYLLHEIQLDVGLCLGGDQIPNRLVEDVLVGIAAELLGSLRHSSYEFSDVRLGLVLLHGGELFGGGLADLEEGVAGHFNDTRVILFHELEELLDDCLQEGPVVLQEVGILAHHVHDA